MKNAVVSFDCSISGKRVIFSGCVKNDPDKEAGILLEGVNVRNSVNFGATIPNCFVPWHLVLSEVRILTPGSTDIQITSKL